jgi:hypothetical protein
VGAFLANRKKTGRMYKRNHPIDSSKRIASSESEEMIQ